VPPGCRLIGAGSPWYYDSGNGMQLSQETRNIYLAAKENLICEVDALKPASLQKQVQASDDLDTIRGWASIRQFSLLRTAMRGDIAIYTSPWGNTSRRRTRSS
jgi:hypothetical protein